MRDISHKISTLRTAQAKSILRASPSTIQLIREGKIPKGNVLEAARVAAIQAAKNTSQIIPFCHPIPIDWVNVEFNLDEDSVSIVTTVKAIYKTGVEMEALTAASVAALTIYDMAKMLDDLMQIETISLIGKTGGKSDLEHLSKPRYTAAVLVMSDSASKGVSEDRSGKLIKKRLEHLGFDVKEYLILPDEESAIVPAVLKCADDLEVNLVITTGGTGISPRDNTPEALSHLFDRDVPGIAEAARSFGQQRNPYSMLSRACAGIRENTLILSLPGSVSGVEDFLDAIFPAVLHAFPMLRGEGHGDHDDHHTPQSAREHAGKKSR